MVGTNIIKSLRDYYVPQLSMEEKAALQAAHKASTPTVTPTPSISDVQVALELEEENKQDLDVRL